MTEHFPVLVRPATPDELDAAGYAVRRAYEAAGYAHDGYLDVLADARDRALDAQIVVAVDVHGARGPAGAVVGSTTFALPGSRWAELSGPGEAEFRMLGVLPTASGLGAGAALVDWCIEHARSLDLKRLVICSLPTMTTAHRLYGRRGFVRRPDLDWSPRPDVTLLGFSLDL